MRCVLSGSDRLTLGFDTSAAHCAAAVILGDRVLARSREDMARGQAERLMPLIEAVLDQAGVTWASLDAIGVGTGPGNFTGVRIAVAAARGLALGLSVPAIGISAPDAYADGRDVIVCLPAQRGHTHLFWGERRQTVETGVFPADWTAPLVGPAAPDLAATTGRPMAESPDFAPQIARLAAKRSASLQPKPTPVYMRAADAAPPSDPPPVLL